MSAGATVFSGDLLITENEGQIQVQAGHIKLALQPNSSFRLFRSGERIVVELERGTVRYANSGGREELVIYGLDVRFVVPGTSAEGGQVTILSRCEVQATNQTGRLDARSGNETKSIEEGKTYSVRSDFGVEYHASWQPVPADYPEFDPNSPYHRSHSHSACGLAENKKGQAPASPLLSHYKLAAIVIVGGVTAVLLWPALESPCSTRGKC